ncbi:MAG: PadR family transcriptional regulator [Candidatus Aminicenantes bacterium]|nr:PadR family transcriptional regulator [Candidatus Aminicenantes bacterium]
MELITRAEELILLAVWRLKEDAYCIPLRAQISDITGEKWSLGSIYMPLDRLVKRGLLDSYLTEATPERGGRRKRIYRLTGEGLRRLQKMRDVETRMWEGIPNLSEER